MEGNLHLACSQDEAIDQDNIFATLVIVYNIMHILYISVLVVFEA